MLKALLCFLSHTHQKWTWNNTVTYQSDKSGPGGIWTHDLSNASYFLSEDSYGKRNPYCSSRTRSTMLLVFFKTLPNGARLRSWTYYKQYIKAFHGFDRIREQNCEGFHFFTDPSHPIFDFFFPYCHGNPIQRYCVLSITGNSHTLIAATFQSFTSNVFSDDGYITIKTTARTREWDSPCITICIHNHGWIMVTVFEKGLVMYMCSLVES